MKHYFDREYDESDASDIIVKYVKYMDGNWEEKCPYSDPDATYNDYVKNPEFYNKLTVFLNNQLTVFLNRKDDLGKLKIQNINEPEKPKQDESKGEPYDRTISITLNTSEPKLHLHLTSDQFGFSAIYDDTWNPQKYPYAKYLYNGGNKAQVAWTVWDTRTIGGSFLWPKVQDNREYWVSTYNTKRGVGNNPVHVDDDFYIEDRVDLTLYEIKEFYEAYIKSKDCDSVNCDSVKKNMSKDSLILRYSDSEEIFIWLSLFGTFENYVNFFCFNDFVNNKDDKYYPKDIFSGESINNENIKEYRDKTGKTYKFIQRNACKEDLETAFINLIAWTRARSERMENIINKTNNSDK